MKTITKTVSSEIVVTKSKFIGNLFHIETKEDAELLIEQVRKKYFDARHNCFAYVIYDKSSSQIIKKSSDDGEPSGTAGAPILECLIGAELVNTLCIVTRYFGGVLLGTGGLTRAYSSSCKESIIKAQSEKIICDLHEGYEINLELPYDLYNQVKRILETKIYKETNSEFAEKVHMKFFIEKTDLASFQKELTNLASCEFPISKSPLTIFTKE